MIIHYPYRILISGKANSGKDETYRLFVDALNIKGHHKKLSFANSMKEIVLKMYPHLNPDWLFGPSNLRENIIKGSFDANGKQLTVRQLLLDLGKFGRKYDEEIWINVLLAEIVGSHCLITDGRRLNELQAAKESKFFMIRVVRPDNKYLVNDISETEMDNIPDSFFDKIIINDGTVDDLKNKVNEIAELIYNNTH